MGGSWIHPMPDPNVIELTTREETVCWIVCVPPSWAHFVVDAAYSVKKVKGSVKTFDVVPSSKDSPVCVLTVKELLPKAPYRSLNCRYRFGICVVRGNVIVPGLVRVSATATPVNVLKKDIPSLYLEGE